MRAVRLAFIGVIGFLVAVVLLQNLTPFVPVRALDEYRKPAPAPDIIGKIVKGDGRVAAAINAWFDDRLGFRPILTRIANQIDYSLFGYSKKVLIGRDGWLFDPVNLEASISQARNPDGLRIELARLGAAAAFLERRNIRLVIISTPAKETIYGEMLPSRVPHRPAKDGFQELRSILKARDGRDWLYIDSQDILTAAKNDGAALYFRTDLHLTAFADLLIAKALVNRIAASQGIAWRWEPRIDMRPEKVEDGSNSRYLSVFSGTPELVEYPTPEARHSPDHPRTDEAFQTSPPEPFELVFHNQNPSPRLPAIVLFGSSFVDRYVTLGAYTNFKDVYRVRGTSDRLGEALRAIPPGTRYFVYQFWEPHLTTLQAAQIPQEKAAQ
jgi:hypothetical protein